MAKSITQLDELGCGLACIASVSGHSYEFIRALAAENQAKTRGFYCRELVDLLSKIGLSYQFRYINQKTIPFIHHEDSIIYIRKSEQYPLGHFVARKNGLWMDPWINFTLNSDVRLAESGYRNRLPGQPIYIIYKEIKKLT